MRECYQNNVHAVWIQELSDFVADEKFVIKMPHRHHFSPTFSDHFILINVGISIFSRSPNDVQSNFRPLSDLKVDISIAENPHL